MSFGRSGGASGSVTVGNGKFLEATWRNEVLRGESSPSRRSGIRRLRCTAWRDGGSRAIRALEMPEPDLLLEFLIVALDAPAQLGQIDQRPKVMSLGRVESQYLVGSFSPSGHSISSHSSGRLSVSL